MYGFKVNTQFTALRLTLRSFVYPKFISIAFVSAHIHFQRQTDIGKSMKNNKKDNKALKFELCVFILLFDLVFISNLDTVQKLITIRRCINNEIICDFFSEFICYWKMYIMNSVFDLCIY